jgi:predicted membrane protein
VKDDIEMIHHLHKIIKKNKLNLKILVRLYPVTNYKKKTLRDLSNLNNVDIDLESLNFFTKENFSKKEISDHLTKKNLLINNARAVFSFGSTFNIEAALELS